MKYKKWSEEEISFVEQNAKLMKPKEILLHLNENLGSERTLGSLIKFANRYDIELLPADNNTQQYSDAVITEVKQLLDKTSYSHAQISKLTGIPKGYVSQIKNGRRRTGPKKRTLPVPVTEKPDIMKILNSVL